MSERWFYRSQGVTRGPVDFDELRRLAQTGELDAGGEVCNVSNRHWRRVDSLIELSNGVKNSHRDVDADRTCGKPGSAEPRDVDCPVEQIQSLNELNFEFVSNRDTAAPAESRTNTADSATPAEAAPAQAVARSTAGRSSLKNDRNGAARRPQPKPQRWFCLIKGIEYGPYRRVELDSMVRRGRIHSQTRIRCGEDSDWVAANRVAGLLERGASALGEGKKNTATHSGRLLRLPRKKTLLLQLALLLTIGAVGYGITDRVRDISDDDLYSRSEMILARHYSLKRSKNPPSSRAQLIEDAKALEQEIMPVLLRTAGSLRPHRQILLIAIRDHLVQMVRNTTDAEHHENAFVDIFRKAKRMWLDPHQRTRIEPTAIEPQKSSTPRTPGSQTEY